MPSRAHAAPAPAFEIAPGMTVGAGRWPLQSAHPADWGVPHEGVVLAMDDPAAWTDTVAFVGVPSAESVRAHLARCAAQGHAIPQVPVRYAFGIR